MKILELKGYGNKNIHFVPIRSIADIEFEREYTHITTIGGKCFNVEERKDTIQGLLRNFGCSLWSEKDLDEYYQMNDRDMDLWEGQMMNDDLPF